MRRLIILVMAVFISGCLAQPPATTTPIAGAATEKPFEEPFVAATVTPMCQHSPGVTLVTRRMSASDVELRVSGLQPGENPSLIYSTSNDVETSLGEAYNFAKGADAHGEFTTILSGLTPLRGQTSSTWDIRFTHSRGVECAKITLP